MEGEQVEGVGAPDASNTQTQDGPKMVPYARLKQTVEARDAATQEAEQLRSRVAELEAAGSEFEAVKAQLSAASTNLRLADLGMVSDEGRDIARALHSRLPEADRPGLADWFADAGKSHPALSGYLLSPASSPAPAAPPASPAAAPPTAPTPNANTGAQAPPPSAPVTQSQVTTAIAAVNANPSEANRATLKALLERYNAGQ